MTLCLEKPGSIEAEERAGGFEGLTACQHPRSRKKQLICRIEGRYALDNACRKTNNFWSILARRYSNGKGKNTDSKGETQKLLTDLREISKYPRIPLSDKPMSNLEKRIFARAMQTWAEHMITLSEGNVEMLTKLTKSMSTIIKSLEKPKGIAGVLDNIGYRLPEDKKGKFTMLVIILIPTVGYFFLRLVAAYEKVFGKIDVLERVRGSQSQGRAPQQGKRE
ncbi:uncharacterized protein LOC127779227 [Oryza glaberrima]|nr:uncharacterized protein LOC127779227 [Oryza glaberrima]